MTKNRIQNIYVNVSALNRGYVGRGREKSVSLTFLTVAVFKGTYYHLKNENG